MSRHASPGHAGPPESTDNEIIERLQAVLVFLIAIAITVAIRIGDPSVHRGVSLCLGLMIFTVGWIEIEYFKEIHRFERRRMRERHHPLF